MKLNELEYYYKNLVEEKKRATFFIKKQINKSVNNCNIYIEIKEVNTYKRNLKIGALLNITFTKKGKSSSLRICLQKLNGKIKIYKTKNKTEVCFKQLEIDVIYLFNSRIEYYFNFLYRLNLNIKKIDKIRIKIQNKKEKEKDLNQIKDLNYILNSFNLNQNKEQIEDYIKEIELKILSLKLKTFSRSIIIYNEKIFLREKIVFKKINIRIELINNCLFYFLGSNKLSRKKLLLLLDKSLNLRKVKDFNILLFNKSEKKENLLFFNISEFIESKEFELHKKIIKF